MKREDIKTAEEILRNNTLNMMSHTNVTNAMKEYANQFIDLSAEEAKTEEIKVDYNGVRAGGFYLKKVINKKSILNIKKLIK